MNNNNIFNGSNASDNNGFNILDYLDKLEKTKEPGKYVCPACGGHNLSISKNGKYNCFNCGDTKKIASILTQPERDQKKWIADIERRNQENIKRAKREELRREAEEDLPDDLVDRFLEIEEGIQQGIEASSPGEKLKLQIQGYLLEENTYTKAVIKLAIQKTYGISPFVLDQLILETAGGSQSGKLEVFSGSEFLNADIQPVNFLVPGVPVGGVTLLAGSAGAGKTTQAYWLARCVLDNLPYLGETPSQMGGVILVNADEGKYSSKDRLDDMDFPDDDRWLYLNRFNVDRHFQTLEEYVRERRPKLLVVDSLAGMHGDGFDENSALVGLTIQKFNALAEIYNCAIVLLHHLNKAGEVRGHSRIKDCVHSIIQLSAQPDGTREYRSTKIRCASTFNYILGLDEEGRPKILRGGDTEFSRSIKQEILGILQTLERPLEVQEICEMTQYSDKQVWQALRTLKDSGKVKCRKSQRDKRAKVWLSISMFKREGGCVTQETSNFAEITTVQELEGEKKYSSEYSSESEETSIFEGETSIFEGETSKKRVIFSGINPSPVSESSEITRLIEGRGGYQKIAWVIFQDEKWSIINYEFGFFSLSQYGKLKPKTALAKPTECQHIEWIKD